MPQDTFTLRDLAGLRDEDRTCYIENALYAGQIALLHGPPQSGKSYMTNQLGVCLAAGADWGKGRFIIRKARRVLCVQTEGSKFDLAERTNPMFELLPRALENFLGWLPRRLDLRSGDQLPILADWIDKCQAEVTFIDSLSSATSGDLNTKGVVSALEVNLRELMRGRNEEMAFVIVHHDHRPRFDQQGNPIDEFGNTYAGSYALDAMCDQRWWLRHVVNQFENEYRFQQMKHRGRYHVTPPFTMELDHVTGILIPEPPSLGDFAAQMRLWFKPRGFVTKDAWRDWCNARNMAPSTRYRYLRGFIKDGQLVEATHDDVKGYEWIER